MTTTLIILGALIIICLLALYIDWGRFVGMEEIHTTIYLSRDIEGKEIIPLFEKMGKRLGEKLKVSVIPYMPVSQYRVREKCASTWTNWMEYNINLKLDTYYNDYEFRKILGGFLILSDSKLRCYICTTEGYNSWYSSSNYGSFKLIFEPIVKWPWNKKKIKSQQEFIKCIEHEFCL